MSEQRQCGECGVCCVRLKCDALDKPPDVQCKHLVPGCQRCAIYDLRPSECQMYKCSWLSGLLPEGCRPDKSGILCETAYIIWPKPLTILFGEELKPGGLVRWRQTIEKELPRGVVAYIIAYRQKFSLAVGTASDLAAFQAWAEQCRRDGSVIGNYVDKSVEIPL